MSFTRQELDLLFEAVGLLEESIPHSLRGRAFGLVTCGDRETAKKIAEHLRIEVDDEMRRRKERSVLLRAKIIQLRDGIDAERILSDAGKLGVKLMEAADYVTEEWLRSMHFFPHGEANVVGEFGRTVAGFDDGDRTEEHVQIVVSLPDRSIHLEEYDDDGDTTAMIKIPGFCQAQICRLVTMFKDYR